MVDRQKMLDKRVMGMKERAWRVWLWNKKQEDETN